eukprot:snap_masked-scaffold_23-processed-gene-3.40-mRNA-1 protein AED:1.00 eAED:1.00 QI:0/0/0/0/1/1/2/0/60
MSEIEPSSNLKCVTLPPRKSFFAWSSEITVESSLYIDANLRAKHNMSSEKHISFRTIKIV